MLHLPNAGAGQVAGQIVAKQNQTAMLAAMETVTRSCKKTMLPSSVVHSVFLHFPCSDFSLGLFYFCRSLFSALQSAAQCPLWRLHNHHHGWIVMCSPYSHCRVLKCAHLQVICSYRHLCFAFFALLEPSRRNGDDGDAEE